MSHQARKVRTERTNRCLTLDECLGDGAEGVVFGIREDRALAVKLRLAWLWWVEDGTESRHGPNGGSDDRTRLLWRLIAEAEALDRPGAGEAR